MALKVSRSPEDDYTGEFSVSVWYTTDPPTMSVDRADARVLLSAELYENPGRLRIRGDLVEVGTEGFGLGVVTYRIVGKAERSHAYLLDRVDP